MVDVYAEFVALVRAFEEGNVEYALCGALALAVHGAPRATKDIDVIARREDADRIREMTKRLGFAFEALPREFSGPGIEAQRSPIQPLPRRDPCAEPDPNPDAVAGVRELARALGPVRHPGASGEGVPVSPPHIPVRTGPGPLDGE